MFSVNIDGKATKEIYLVEDKVSALFSGSTSLGSSPNQVRCIVFLGKS